MASPSQTCAPLLSSQQPTIVMVVADDEVQVGRARSATRFVASAQVVEARTGREAVQRVEACYESPCGCPDVVVLSGQLADADWARQRLQDTCPGVRVLDSSDLEDGGVERLRELVDAVQAAFA